MKIIFTSILFAFTFLPACAQESFTDKKSGITYISTPDKFNLFPDSIKIELPDQKGVVIFQCKEIIREINYIDEFPGHLRKWVAQLATMSPSTTAPRKITILTREHYDDEIRIVEDAEHTTRARMHDSNVTELLPPGWEITVLMKTMHVYVYAQTFKDLEALAQQSLSPVRDDLKHYLEQKPMRKSIVSRYILTGDKITFHENKRQIAGDFLELNMRGGLGFYGDKIYPELNPYAELVFGDRFHRKNYKVSFIYNNLFFTERNPDGGYTTRPNSFLSVSWSKNLVFKKAEPSWLSFGAGILIHKSGNYFPGKTAKFFIGKDIGHFNLAPELYLTNDFKNAQMGFRINYTF